MENTQNLKEENQKLIHEKIITQGYDSINFIEFLSSKKAQGDNVSNWTKEELNSAIEEYIKNNPKKNTTPEKNDENNPQKLEDTEKSNLPAPAMLKNGPSPVDNLAQSFLSILGINKENIPPEKKVDKSKYDYGLKVPNSIKCKSIDETELGKQTEIVIKIGFPEKKDGGFFGRTIIEFTVAAVPLGFVVKRSYSDFEWLKNTLLKLYDSNFIPSLPEYLYLPGKDQENAFFKELIRNAEKFMDYLINDPLIKNSQILYDFLSVENPDEFKKKKYEYENQYDTPQTPTPTPMGSNLDLGNKTSVNGEVNILISKDAEDKLNNSKKFLNENNKLLHLLNINFKHFYNDLNDLLKRIKDISNGFEKLYKNCEKYNEDAYLQECYLEMNNMFNNMNNSLKKQNEFIKTEIAEQLTFIENNFSNITDLIKKVDNLKNIYYKEEKDLIVLKNDLFNKNNINIGIISDNDKNLQLSQLLPKNTEATVEIKKNYGYYLNRTISEYDRLKNLNCNYIYKNKIFNVFKSFSKIISGFSASLGEIMASVDVFQSDQQHYNNMNNVINDNSNNNENNINNI